MTTKQSRELEKGSWFAGVTKSPADIENIKANISEFFFYAYITHKPDNDDDRLHVHYVVQCNGSRTLGSVAKVLDVDSQYLQICRRPRGACRYLRHLDNPEKEQYSFEDVVTNNAQFLTTFYTDNQSVDVVSLYRDMAAVSSGALPPDCFIDKYRFHLDKLPFDKKLNCIRGIMKIR